MALKPDHAEKEPQMFCLEYRLASSRASSHIPEDCLVSNVQLYTVQLALDERQNN